MIRSKVISLLWCVCVSIYVYSRTWKMTNRWCSLEGVFFIILYSLYLYIILYTVQYIRACGLHSVSYNPAKETNMNKVFEKKFQYYSRNRQYDFIVIFSQSTYMDIVQWNKYLYGFDCRPHLHNTVRTPRYYLSMIYIYIYIETDSEKKPAKRSAYIRYPLYAHILHRRRITTIKQKTEDRRLHGVGITEASINVLSKAVRL